MRNAILILLSLIAIPAVAQTRPGWTPVWQEEFNGPNIDTTKWGYDVGNWGWGNSELEYYTSRPENAYIENGMLVIKAIREEYYGSHYTSARMKTQGKFNQTYGRFEARIKIPFGQGIWPAFWMLGEDITTVNWPTCGEIDIMEVIGKEPGNVYGTIHGPGAGASNIGVGGKYTLPGGKQLADDFHVYAIEWEPAALRIYLDDVLYKTVTPADMTKAGGRWVFDHPFFLILNVAVGGTWPGNPDATTQFPQSMYVDYVRTYQRAPKPVVTQGAAVNGASFEAGITPGSWATISGTALSQTTRLWAGADFTGSALPTQLDGVSVNINGKPAYIEYVSPTQINFVVPDVGAGPATIEVSNNGIAGDPVQADVQALHPAFFLWWDAASQKNYAVATRTDYSLVARTGLFANSTPARPGEAIILWGTGFGLTDPPMPPSQLVSGANSLVNAPAVRIGGTPARYLGGALSPGLAGLYQIAVEVPASTPAGDVKVAADIAGATSADNVYLTVAAN